MITATKAFLAFCLLAVVGTVLVIGPTELRRLLPGGANTEVAAVAKPESKPGAKADPAAQTKAEAKIEPNTEPKAAELKAAEPKAAESKAEPKLAAVSPAPSAAPATADAPKTGALAETQSRVAALADIAPSKPQPPVADTGPRFDVARVDDHGEAAVIAGQAVPGSKVELLRDGQPLDSVVADASGQFVMTPPKLPAGSYELALRAKAPDGTVTQSSRTMPVTVAETAPPPARVAAVAKPEAKPEAKPNAKSEEKPQDTKPDDKPDVVASLPSQRLAATSAARPRTMSAPKPRALARVPATDTTVASASPAEILNATPAEAGGSRVISRGDSLWALSRLAYGDGARYAVIFNANREKIKNPNLIYPGQTVLVPQKAQ
ncbi:LysM peptidoglycan-binding domain-containing protein [Bradyrhizobium manausense]|uniref:LysM peptidoglycan-binding domain-containing protein n=1 Tax=Bradyrhizobium manausense TaxID=989370 RepID=UPI001BAA511E|nr:LysM peptidoglycan-binding domain-containing protein [Bradyrhizobium manausense]MBR1092627.1 LysM peptidoglycan-binding domain-containing protein [Bradyrhizobium manausense]